MGAVLGYILLMSFSMSFYLLFAVFVSILLLNILVLHEYPSLFKENKPFFTFIVCGVIISLSLNVAFMSQLKPFFG